MKIFLKILPFLIMIGSFIYLSCNNKIEDCYAYDYSDCNSVRPNTGTMVIHLTIKDDSSAIPVKIFRGKFEDNDLFLADTLTDGLWRVDLPLDQYYSVAAYYKKEGKYFIAIDGEKIVLKSVVKCDSTCYSVKQAEVDVRLKY